LELIRVKVVNKVKGIGIRLRIMELGEKNCIELGVECSSPSSQEFMNDWIISRKNS